MPLYEYQCKKCKTKIEKIQKFSDPLLKKCPDCGGRLEKLLSPPAIQFKGSGWYVTDYARKNKPVDEKIEEKKEKKESREPAKTESKDKKAATASSK